MITMLYLVLLYSDFDFVRRKKVIIMLVYMRVCECLNPRIASNIGFMHAANQNEGFK